MRIDEDAALVRTNEIAAMFGFGALRDIDRSGRHVFYGLGLDSVELKVKYQDDLIAALFVKRSCLDAQVAQPSAEALEILGKGISDPGFMRRLQDAFKDTDDTARPIRDYCLTYLVTNPAWLTTESYIERLLSDVLKIRKDEDKARRENEERVSRSNARNRAIERDQRKIAERNERIRERDESRRDRPSTDCWHTKRLAQTSYPDLAGRHGS